MPDITPTSRNDATLAFVPSFIVGASRGGSPILRDPIERLGAGQFPPVDRPMIVQRLAWLSAAELVANFYVDVCKRIPLVAGEMANRPNGRAEDIGRPQSNLVEVSA